MIHFSGVVMRNPTLITKHRRRAYSTYKAMRQYRKTHLVCEWTGATKHLQLHHIIPISVCPALADHPDNFIMLEYNSHRSLGHPGGYKNYTKNLRRLIAEARRIRTLRYQESG